MKLSASLQKIIDTYQKDLEWYIQKYSLDTETASDIRERIQEKVEALEHPTRTDILQILAEIGTPEEIFREEIEMRSEHDVSDTHLSLWKRIQKRTEGILFLGVFHELSKITHISVNILRFVYLCIIWVSFLVEPGLVLIFAVIYVIGFLILRTGFFRFLFAGGLALIAGVLLVGAIVVFSLYITNFRIDNMYVFGGLLPVFPIGMIIGIFSLILFFLYFFGYAFTKKWFGVGFLLTAIVSFLVAVSLGVVTAVDIFVQFKERGEQRFSYTIPIPENTETIDTFVHSFVNESSLFESRFMIPVRLTMHNAKIGISEDDQIHIEWSTIMYRAKYATWYVQNVNFSMNEYGVLQAHIRTDTENMYPLSFVEINISEIRIPAGQDFIAMHWNVPYPLLHDIQFLHEESYSRGQRDMLGRWCHKYYFTSENMLMCNASVEEIEEMLAPDPEYHEMYFQEDAWDVWYQEEYNTNMGDVHTDDAMWDMDTVQDTEEYIIEHE